MTIREDSRPNWGTIFSAMTSWEPSLLDLRDETNGRFIQTMREMDGMHFDDAGQPIAREFGDTNERVNEIIADAAREYEEREEDEFLEANERRVNKLTRQANFRINRQRELTETLEALSNSPAARDDVTLDKINQQTEDMITLEKEIQDTTFFGKSHF